MDEEQKDEDLRTMVALLRKHVDGLSVVAERLRETLKQRTVLSDGEIEQALTEGRRLGASAMLKKLQEAVPAFGKQSARRTRERLELKEPT